MFNRDHVNAIAKMFRPPGDGPLSESLNITVAANVIVLRDIAFLKRIIKELVKDTQDFLPVASRNGGEYLKHGVIYRISIWPHRPSEASLSCSCSNSSAE